MHRYITPLSISRAGVVIIGALSFWLSYIALTALARDSGFGATEAYVWPIIVDGVVVVSTIALFATRDKFAAFLLVCAASVSLAGNGIHAWDLTGSWIAVAAFEVPPLALLAVAHLSMRLSKHAEATKRAASDAELHTFIDNLVAEDATEATRSTQTPETVESVPEPAGDTADEFTPASGILSPLEKIDRAYELLDEGISNRQVAAHLGVSEASVRRWKAKRDGSDETADESIAEPAA